MFSNFCCCGGQFIAGSVHRQNYAGDIALGHQLASEPGDMSVDGAVGGGDRIAIDQIHDPVPGQHISGGLGQCFCKRKFGAGQAQISAIRKTFSLGFQGIQLDVFEPDPACRRGVLGWG
ncbi:MAG: hypothetical protein COB16_02935 [Rhodobacteraceae bacterium]|nr:MAG: hypothetical protein COB16_02935 [Paracoccaceae bacterium]